MNRKSTAILGAGGWGTALASLWAKDGRDIVLWGHNPERVEQFRSSRENKDYLSGIKLPDNVRITSELSDCAESGVIVFVVPSTAFREIAEKCRDKIPADAVLLSCTKGIEHGTDSNS